jgi:putative ABC transport system permease protein
MKLRDLIKLANRQLFNRKWQALLPILSLVVGSITLTFGLGAGFGVQDLFDKELAAEKAPRLIKVTPEPSTEEESPQEKKPVPVYESESKQSKREQITTSLQEMILSDEQLTQATAAPFVKEASPLYSFRTRYVEMEGLEQKYDPNTKRMFENTEFEMLAGQKTNAKDDVVVTQAFSELDGVGAPQDLVGKTLTVAYPDVEGKEQSKEFRISGVRAGGLRSSARVFVPYQATVAIAKAQVKDPSQLQAREAVLLLDEGLNSDQRERTREALKDKNFRLLDYAQAKDTTNRIGLYITLALSAFGGVVIFAALFGVTNTMSMSVYERIRQIGLMKALGMSSGTVFLLFATEGAFIGLWGAVIGFLIAYAISVFILNPWLAGFFADKGVDTPFQLVFPPEWIAGVILGLMVIAFLASTLPARRAAALNPIDALRYE